MIAITPEALIAITRGRKNNLLLAPLAKGMNYWFEVFGIDTKAEVCHFLAQAAHETASFSTLTEYGTKAKPAGSAYEGRRDLGNINPGDGVRYKGRGIFQITGRINYRRLDTVGLFETNPELLATPSYAVWSACVYWNDKHLSDIAIRPDSDLIYSKYLNKKLTPIEYITFRINGGQNGIKERKAFYERAKNVFL